MSEKVLKVYKTIVNIPTPYEKNAIYFVRRNGGFDLYVSDSTGQVVHKINNYKSNLQLIINPILFKKLDNEYTIYSHGNKTYYIDARIKVVSNTDDMVVIIKMNNIEIANVDLSKRESIELENILIRKNTSDTITIKCSTTNSENNGVYVYLYGYMFEEYNIVE